MGLELVPTNQGKTILLNKAIVFFGRHPECDVVLKKSRKVSRKHCCIAQIDDHFIIRDLGSTNGIQVNGKRVQKVMQFKIGDKITIGDLEYLVKPEGTQKPKKVVKKSDDIPAAEQIIPQRLDISQEVPVALPESNEIDIVSDSQQDVPVAKPVSKENPIDVDDVDEGNDAAKDADQQNREDSHHDMGMLAE